VKNCDRVGIAFKFLVEFSKSAKLKTSRLLFLNSRLFPQKEGESLEETKPERIFGYSPIIFSHSPMDLIYWRMVLEYNYCLSSV